MSNSVATMPSNREQRALDHRATLLANNETPLPGSCALCAAYDETKRPVPAEKPISDGIAAELERLRQQAANDLVALGAARSALAEAKAEIARWEEMVPCVNGRTKKRAREALGEPRRIRDELPGGGYREAAFVLFEKADEQVTYWLARAETAEARERETIADAIEAMNANAMDCGCWERIKADFMKARAALASPSEPAGGKLESDQGGTPK